MSAVQRRVVVFEVQQGAIVSAGAVTAHRQVVVAQGQRLGKQRQGFPPLLRRRSILLVVEAEDTRSLAEG